MDAAKQNKIFQTDAYWKLASDSSNKPKNPIAIPGYNLMIFARRLITFMKEGVYLNNKKLLEVVQGVMGRENDLRKEAPQLKGRLEILQRSISPKETKLIQQFHELWEKLPYSVSDSIDTTRTILSKAAGAVRSNSTEKKIAYSEHQRLHLAEIGGALSQREVAMYNLEVERPLYYQDLHRRDLIELRPQDKKELFYTKLEYLHSICRYDHRKLDRKVKEAIFSEAFELRDGNLLAYVMHRYPIENYPYGDYLKDLPEKDLLIFMAECGLEESMKIDFFLNANVPARLRQKTLSHLTQVGQLNKGIYDTLFDHLQKNISEKPEETIEFIFSEDSYKNLSERNKTKAVSLLTQTLCEWEKNSSPHLKNKDIAYCVLQFISKQNIALAESSTTKSGLFNNPSQNFWYWYSRFSITENDAEFYFLYPIKTDITNSFHRTIKETFAQPEFEGSRKVIDDIVVRREIETQKNVAEEKYEELFNYSLSLHPSLCGMKLVHLFNMASDKTTQLFTAFSKKILANDPPNENDVKKIELFLLYLNRQADSKEKLISLCSDFSTFILSLPSHSSFFKTQKNIGKILINNWGRESSPPTDWRKTYYQLFSKFELTLADFRRNDYPRNLFDHQEGDTFYDEMAKQLPGEKNNSQAYEILESMIARELPTLNGLENKHYQFAEKQISHLLNKPESSYSDSDVLLLKDYLAVLNKAETPEQQANKTKVETLMKEKEEVVNRMLGKYIAAFKEPHYQIKETCGAIMTFMLGSYLNLPTKHDPNETDPLKTLLWAIARSDVRYHDHNEAEVYCGKEIFAALQHAFIHNIPKEYFRYMLDLYSGCGQADSGSFRDNPEYQNFLLLLLDPSNFLGEQEPKQEKSASSARGV